MKMCIFNIRIFSKVSFFTNRSRNDNLKEVRLVAVKCPIIRMFILVQVFIFWEELWLEVKSSM